MVINWYRHIGLVPNPRLWLSDRARSVLTRFADELRGGAATDLGFRGDRPTAVSVMLGFARQCGGSLSEATPRQEANTRYWDVRVDDDLALGEDGQSLSRLLERAVAEFERRRHVMVGPRVIIQPKTREPVTLPMTLLRSIAAIGAGEGLYPAEEMHKLACLALPIARERLEKLGNGGARDVEIAMEYHVFGVIEADANVIGMDAHLLVVDIMASLVRETPEFRGEWARAAARKQSQ